MAWNRPTETEKRSAPTAGARRGRRAALPALAVLCVLLAGGAWWLLSRGGGEGTDKAGGATGTLRRTIPSRTTQSRAIPSRANSDGSPAQPRSDAAVARRSGPTNKVDLTRNVKPPTVLGCDYYECVSGGRPLFAKPVFSNSAENIIGGLLSARPGERFVPVELGEDFDADFAEALKTPIVAEEGDGPDVAALKEAVARAKERIAAGAAAGHRPSEVVESMRDEMNRIADYRDLLQEDFDKIKETGSARKISAYLKEANQLLDEFGAEHLDLPDDEVEEINKRLSKDGEGKEKEENDDDDGNENDD